ncbi:MAG: transcription termination factor NusA [Clostridia bacterium]|nr:transcription termination factor NusA [Clostridia bacterium]
MAKRKIQEPSQIEQILTALEELEKENNIPKDYMMEKIEKAISTACKNNYGNEDVSFDYGEDGKGFNVYLNYTVIDDDFENMDPNKHIYTDIAQEKYGKLVEPGDVVREKIDTKEFGRIAAQTARNIIRQGIRDSERGQMMAEFNDRKQELVSALVDRIDPKTGALTVRIGKSEAVLPEKELIGTENIKEGDYIQVYIAEVREGDRGPRAVISRTHPDFVKRLFEKEVPEIFDGIVEIKGVSREAGSRTKLAVLSHDENVDAVGACIGPRGTRVENIVKELGGEKIDVIEYSEDPAKFVAAALSPAKVVSVEVAEDGTQSCKATVPDHQLSLAIGNKGQNARLAAKLTGWKIDIRPESGFYGE